MYVICLRLVCFVFFSSAGPHSASPSISLTVCKEGTQPFECREQPNTYTHTYIHYIHYIHTTYITYIHTDIHTYIHTGMAGWRFPCPKDTIASATTRFSVECLAWVAGPWAAASLTGCGWRAAVPVAVLLVGAPAIFSTPGDKHQVLVPTPGRVRLLGVELPLHAVALAAPLAITSSPYVLAATSTLVAASVGAGWNRSVWLWDGAPSPPSP